MENLIKNGKTEEINLKFIYDLTKEDLAKSGINPNNTIKGNRDINNDNKKVIKDGFHSNGRQFDEPIIVNSRNMRLLDGRHRLTVFIGDGMDHETIEVIFKYFSTDEEEFEFVNRINNHRKKWSGKDSVFGACEYYKSAGMIKNFVDTVNNGRIKGQPKLGWKDAAIILTEDKLPNGWVINLQNLKVSSDFVRGKELYNEVCIVRQLTSAQSLQPVIKAWLNLKKEGYCYDISKWTSVLSKEKSLKKDPPIVSSTKKGILDGLKDLVKKYKL